VDPRKNAIGPTMEDLHIFGVGCGNSVWKEMGSNGIEGMKGMNGEGMGREWEGNEKEWEGNGKGMGREWLGKEMVE
jgi:hypothetical protein